MRIKNLGNHAVIKAITIGLSAVMATAQPMMVLAEDAPAKSTEPQPTQEMQDADAAADVVVDEVKDETKENVESVSEAVADVVAAADKDNLPIDNVPVIDGQGQPVTDEQGKPVMEDRNEQTNQDINNKAKELDTAVGTVKNDADALADSVDDIVEAGLAETAAGNVLSGKVASDEDVDSITGGYEQIVSDAESVVNDANDTIANAGTIEEAQKAFDDAVATAKSAQDEYSDAKEKLDKLKKEYDDAKTAYGTAYDAYMDLLKKVAGLKPGDKGYDAEMESEIKNALANLDTARGIAEELEQMANEAQDKVDELYQAACEKQEELKNGYQDIIDAKLEKQKQNNADLEKYSNHAYRLLAERAHNAALQIGDHKCENEYGVMVAIADQINLLDGIASEFRGLAVETENNDAEIISAKETIKELQQRIWALQKTPVDYSEFEAKLKEAQLKLDKLKEKADDLKKKADDLEDVLDRTIERLTPSPSSDSGDDDADDGDDDATGDVVIPVGSDTNAVIPAGLVGGATAGAVTGGAGAGAGTGAAAAATTNIGDNQTPLSDGSNVAGDNVIKVENGKDTKDIKDNKVPLANVPIEQSKAGFWWLIFAAIAAVTGAGSYKYYDNNKKKAVAEDETKE